MQPKAEHTEYHNIIDAIEEALKDSKEEKAFNPEKDYPKINWQTTPLVFDEQREWILSEKKRKGNNTGRQKGKTEGNVFDQLNKEFTHWGSPTSKWKGYFMESGDKAKDQYWNRTIDLAKQEFGIKLKEINSKNMLIFPTGCPIHFRGLDNMKQVNWIRGLPFYHIIVDECGSLNPEYLKSFITEAAKYAIYAAQGTMALTGTPALQRHHYWNELIEKNKKTYFNYPFWCNTFIDKEYTKEFFIEDLKDLGMKEEDIDPEKLDDPEGKPAKYKREVLGLLAFEDSGHCFHFEDDKNACDIKDIPYKLGEEGVEYIISGDPAYNDNAAIGVWVYSTKDDSKNIYLAEEFSEKNVDTDRFVEMYSHLCDIYSPVKCVIDAKGSGGKMLQATISNRYGIHVEPAQQKQKAFGITQMASAINRGWYKCPYDSILRQEIDKVEWDYRGRNFDRNKFHGDIVDCAVYAYIEAYNFLFEPEKKPKIIKTHKQMLEGAELDEDEAYREWQESLDIT